MDSNKDFEVKSKYYANEKIYLPSDHGPTTTCIICDHTCHKKCSYPNDKDKRKCCAM